MAHPNQFKEVPRRPHQILAGIVPYCSPISRALIVTNMESSGITVWTRKLNHGPIDVENFDIAGTLQTERASFGCKPTPKAGTLTHKTLRN